MTLGLRHIGQAAFDLPTPTALLATIEVGVLARSFVIAVVILAPVWLLTRRRMQRRSTGADGEPTLAPDPAATDPTATGPDRLEDVIAAVPAAAASAIEDGSSTLDVPLDVTIDGVPADRSTVDVLVGDALRRSGVVVAAETNSDWGRTLELRPTAVGRDH